MKTEILNTQQAGVLIERKLKTAKISLSGTGFNLLTESRLARPRGLVKKLSSPPPLIQTARCKRASYDKAALTRWVDAVLVPALKIPEVAKVDTLEKRSNCLIPSLLQPTLSQSESVQKTDKEAFLSDLIALAFKMSDTTIKNDSFSKVKFGAVPHHRLRSTITLSIVKEVTGVDILKEFNLVHAIN